MTPLLPSRPWRDDDLREAHVRWLEELSVRGAHLSTWEQTFVEDLQEKLQADPAFYLTATQADKLEEIWIQKGGGDR